MQRLGGGVSAPYNLLDASALEYPRLQSFPILARPHSTPMAHLPAATGFLNDYYPGPYMFHVYRDLIDNL